MRLYNYIKKLTRLEPYFFYLFIGLNIIPILSFQSFLTVDGPAYLYNSNLIASLFADGNSPIQQFFAFNKTLTPNWTGHLIMSTLSAIFPSFVIEKIILLIYVIGLPLSIRYLFKCIGIKNRHLLYLIFPFTYSYLFYYGFYNFNIGLVLFFFGIGMWVKFRKQITVRNFIKLTIISSLICFSHLFVFAFFLLSVFILSFEDIPMLKARKAETTR